jgi:D-amino-acid oxidase
VRVTVVGAGVVGLTCAVRLLQEGHRVDVLARDLPLETTSAVAAATWYPYRAFPSDRVLAWSARSYDAFAALAGVDRAGVTMRSGIEVFAAPQDEPWWRSAVPALDHVPPPAGYGDAWTFVAPVVEMPVYLSWLASRVEELGGTITRLNLSALPVGPDVVVHCAGIGARLLAADASVGPVRGQVVHLSQVGLERWYLDSSADLTYVVPRAHDIVVGGTAQEGEWSRTPSPEDAEAILARARRLVPELEAAAVLRHRVGLRPARPQVRVERAASGGSSVVHCYGHGGAGVTLSWGTADEVVDLVSADPN